MTEPHRCSIAEPIQALGPQIPCPVVFPGNTPLPGLPSLTLWVLHDLTPKKEIFRSLILSKAFPELLLGVRLCAGCFMRYTDYKSHKTSRERQQHRRGSGECVHTWEPRKDSKGQGSQFPLWRLDIRADKSTEATEMQLHFYCEFSMHKEAVACFLSVGIMFHSRYDGYIYMAAWLGHGVPRYSVKHLPKYSVEHYSECVWEGVSGWD